MSEDFPYVPIPEHMEALEDFVNVDDVLLRGATAGGGSSSSHGSSGGRSGVTGSSSRRASR